MPPSGLPDAYLDGGEDPLGWILRRFARGRGPFTTDEAARRFGLEPERVEELLARARSTSCAASCGPAAPSASGATPTSSGGSAAPAWRGCGRRSSPPTRARSAASSRLAGSRPARDAPRGARSAPGPLAPGGALGERRAAAARARLPAGLARPADRVRRGRLGGCGPRARRALLPGGRAALGRPARCRRPRARRTRRSARRSRAGRSSGSTSSARPASRARSRFPRSGTSSGPAR